MCRDTGLCAVVHGAVVFVVRMVGFRQCLATGFQNMSPARAEQQSLLITRCFGVVSIMVPCAPIQSMMFTAIFSTLFVSDTFLTPASYFPLYYFQTHQSHSNAKRPIDSTSRSCAKLPSDFFLIPSQSTHVKKLYIETCSFFKMQNRRTSHVSTKKKNREQ